MIIRAYKLACPPSRRPTSPFLPHVRTFVHMRLRRSNILTLVSQEGPEGHLLLLFLLRRYVTSKLARYTADGRTVPVVLPPPRTEDCVPMIGVFFKDRGARTNVLARCPVRLTEG